MFLGIQRYKIWVVLSRINWTPSLTFLLYTLIVLSDRTRSLIKNTNLTATPIMFRPQRFVKIIFHSIKRSKMAFREEASFWKIVKYKFKSCYTSFKILYILNHWHGILQSISNCKIFGTLKTYLISPLKSRITS